MYYCDSCRLVFEESVCQNCGRRLRCPAENDPCFLIEKQEIYAGILREYLENHHIPYYDEAAMGVGLSMKVGPMLERYRFYVPYAHYEKALKCVETLFSQE